MRTLLDSAQTLGACRRALLLDPVPRRSPPRRTDACPTSAARRAHQPPPMGQPHRQAPAVLTHGALGICHRSEHVEHTRGRERHRRTPRLRPRRRHRLHRPRQLSGRARHPQRGCTDSPRVLRGILRRNLPVRARPAHLGHGRPAARLQAHLARAADRVLFAGAIHHRHGECVPGRHPSTPLNSPTPSPHHPAFALSQQRFPPVVIFPDPYKQKTTALDGVALVGEGVPGGGLVDEAGMLALARGVSCPLCC